MLVNISTFTLKYNFRFFFLAHRVAPLSENSLDELVGVLFRLLDRNDGTIRHHVVKTLCELGLERKDVILKLVPKLTDPVVTVREEVKKALEQMAGKIFFITFLTIPYNF